MKSFLADYGLEWVGSGRESQAKGTFDINQLQSEMIQQPLYNFNLPKEIDIEVLKRRVEELNIVA